MLAETAVGLVGRDVRHGHLAMVTLFEDGHAFDLLRRESPSRYWPSCLCRDRRQALGARPRRRMPTLSRKGASESHFVHQSWARLNRARRKGVRGVVLPTATHTGRLRPQLVFTRRQSVPAPTNPTKGEVVTHKRGDIKVASVPSQAADQMHVVNVFAKNAFEEVRAYLQPYMGRQLAHIRVFSPDKNDRPSDQQGHRPRYPRSAQTRPGG